MLVATKDSVGIRITVCCVAIALGIFLILTGIHNVKTRKAEESGGARITNRILGKSNTYDGKKAVALGVVRIICGVGMIVFGIIFIFVGPFLANA
ncbi:MAG: hypothetical protein LBQ20_00850 [Rhodanobacter sp.]|jgi:hypothetical protein|nr:hypothetical protein [Rhodanobacter sp.]